MKTILVAAIALVLAACATPTPNSTQPVAEEKTYVTGSRLSVKDKNAGSGTVITAAPPAPYMPRGAGAPSATMGGN